MPAREIQPVGEDPARVLVMYDLAVAVAAALGRGWTGARGPDPDRTASLTHRDGRGLFLTILAYGPARGRITLSGEYPRPWRPRDDEDCRITVARTRPPRAIAAEIRRRLLPAYEPRLASARKIVAEMERQVACRAETAAEILAAVPGADLSPVQPRDCGIALTLRGYGYRHDVRIRTGTSGTEIDVDLRGLRAADAVRMLTALGAAERGTVTANAAPGEEQLARPARTRR